MLAPMSEAACTLNHGRRFRFSLRTFLVVPTVICCWLGYEVNWLRQRQAFISYERTLHAAHFANHGWNIGTHPTYASVSAPSPPGLLWFFGEQGYENVSILTQVAIPKQITSKERQRLAQARSLFPEAKIQTIHVFNLAPFGHAETVGEPE